MNEEMHAGALPCLSGLSPPGSAHMLSSYGWLGPAWATKYNKTNHFKLKVTLQNTLEISLVTAVQKHVDSNVFFMSQYHILKRCLLPAKSDYINKIYMVQLLYM